MLSQRAIYLWPYTLYSTHVRVSCVRHTRVSFRSHDLGPCLKRSPTRGHRGNRLFLFKVTHKTLPHFHRIFFFYSPSTFSLVLLHLWQLNIQRIACHWVLQRLVFSYFFIFLLLILFWVLAFVEYLQSSPYQCFSLELHRLFAWSLNRILHSSQRSPGQLPRPPETIK